MKIEGFFSNFKHAKDTVAELKKKGFDKANVDLNEHYINEMNVQTNPPGTEASPSLSGLVLESDEHVVDRSKAPMTAASPMVSGIGNFDEIADVNYKVIVETGEGDTDRVKQIIKSGGGELEDPNVKLPKRMEDINYL